MKRYRERKPNFFIVGAPKCATTAFDYYLGMHPEIFMCRKERHYFGRDLAYSFARPTLQEYLAEFEKAKDEMRLGETAVWYLYSKTAADEIKAFCPDANIIIMLRDPVDMLYSYHSQILLTGHEVIESFQDALAAEQERRGGVHLPHHVLFPESLLYREVASFGVQVERYFRLFDADKIMVILYDDLKRDIASVYRAALRFLGVSQGYLPEFTVKNRNKVIRSGAMKHLLIDGPASMKALARRLVPRGVRQGIYKTLYQLNLRFNTAIEERFPLAEGVRRSLRADLTDDIEKLSKIIGRDLSSWLGA